MVFKQAGRFLNKPQPLYKFAAKFSVFGRMRMICLALQNPAKRSGGRVKNRRALPKSPSYQRTARAGLGFCLSRVLPNVSYLLA
jgi:hypothetical protein